MKGKTTGARRFSEWVCLAVMIGVFSMAGGTARAQTPLSADPGIKPKAPLDPNRPLDRELKTSVNGSLTMVTVGSLTIANPSGPLAAFDPAIVRLTTGSETPAISTVTVGDLETSLVDLKSFEGYPYAWDSRPVPIAAREVANSLRTAGFSLLALANGHTLDWGIEGMRSSESSLDAAGIIHAGTGLNAGLARSARYYDDPHGRGRVALVSAASTFRPTSNALSPDAAAPGRAGVSGLNVEAVRIVPPDDFKRLQQVACRFQYYQVAHDCTVSGSATSVTMLGSTFETGDSSLYYTTDYRLNDREAQQQLRFVRQAREHSDFLVVSLHADQTTDARLAAPHAPRFLENFAHAAIDSGTDVVMMTGSAKLEPVEIYWSPGRPPRPIFYGLGNFYWSPGLGPPHEDRTTRWSVIARSNVVSRRLIVDLYPIDLSADATHPEGSPRLADKTLSTEILQMLSALSAPYKTAIAIIPYGATYEGRIVEEGTGAEPRK